MSFAEHWLEIVTAVYLVGMILYGHHRGFIRLAVSLVSLVLTLVVVYAAMPYATDWLKDNTPVYGMIQNGLVKAVRLDEKLPDRDEGLDEQPPEGSSADTEIGTGMESRIEGEDAQSLDETVSERMMIEGLRLPKQIKKILIDNNSGKNYEELGVTIFRDYVSVFLTDLVLRVFAFALLFFLIYVILHILVIWLDLVARLPILSGLNKVAGALMGGLEALIVIWIACLILTGISGTELGVMLLDKIDESGWLSFLYYNNLLSQIVFGVLGGIK